MRSVIDIKELSVFEIDELVATAKDIIANPNKYAHKCEGKKLATLFFEPSTRPAFPLRRQCTSSAETC